MIYATILLALIFTLCLARIHFLNLEVKELDLAGRKLSAQIDHWSSGAAKGGVALTHEAPIEIQEVQTEHEWATNARDSPLLASLQGVRSSSESGDKWQARSTQYWRPTLQY